MTAVFILGFTTGAFTVAVIVFVDNLMDRVVFRDDDKKEGS